MSNTQAPTPTPPDSSGPPLRALAMVLISLAIVFAALGLFSLTDSDSAADTNSAAAPAAETTSAAAATTTAAAPAPTSAPSASGGATSSGATSTTASAAESSVRVLNNSNVSGLAARTAETIEQSGFTVGETGNYSDGTIASTTVFYQPSVAGQQAEAERIAAALGAQAQPRFAGIEDAAPGIVVIVTE